MKVPAKTQPGPYRRFLRRGFTLVELTLAMMMGMIVAAMVLTLFNQQLAFLRIFQAQNFLTGEAPVINNYLSRVIGRADGFRLYRSLGDIGGGNPVMDDATILLLRFREPNGVFRACVLSFEDPGTGQGQGLYYRVVSAGGVLSAPQWALTTKPANVNFAIEQGILRVRLTGPNGEEVIYSGTQQL